MLSPEEQDNEILRCLRPLKGNVNVQATFAFMTSMFGGSTTISGTSGTSSTGSAGTTDFTSTITDGCQRMGMNVSYFDVLTRIKEREDVEEDQLHLHALSAPRPSITDPSRAGVVSSPPPVSTPTTPNKAGDFPSKASAVNPAAASAVPVLLELKVKLKPPVNNGTIHTLTKREMKETDISKASELLGLSVNNTKLNFGPPDELGRQATIPRGELNFVALQQATSCLCTASTSGHGDYDEHRTHNIHHIAGNGCIDQLDSANGMINMQWRSVVRSRIATLEHDLEEAKRRPARISPRIPVTPPLDVAAMVKRIHVQKESLIRATNTLNSELDSRWKRGPTIHGNSAYLVNPKNQHLTPVSGSGGGSSGSSGSSSDARFQSSTAALHTTDNGVGGVNSEGGSAILSAADSRTTTVPDTHSAGFGPASDGSCGSTLYKAWEQIKILEEETEKLRVDLRQCRAEPDK